MSKKRILIAGICLLAVVCLIVADAAWIMYSSRTAKAELTARADRLEKWLDRQYEPRPVLWGEAEPGNAWEAYGEAVELVERDAHVSWRKIVWEMEPGEEARVARDAFLDDHAQALEKLSRGAHREDAMHLIRWQEGHFPSVDPIPNLLKSRSLMNVAVLQSERLLDEGEPERAVQVLLDAMQFGRDLLEKPRLIDELIGAAMLSIPTRGALIQFDQLDRFPVEQLEELAAGMAILDASLPKRSLGSSGDLLLFIHSIKPSFDGGWPFSWRAWPHGFSEWSMIASGVGEIEVLVEEELVLSEGPWSEQRRRGDQLREELMKSSNQFMQVWANNVLGTSSRLGAIKSLRLSRMAIMLRLNAGVEPLPDPFGDKLTYEEQGDKLVIQSRGREEKSGEHDRVEIPLKPAAPSGR